MSLKSYLKNVSTKFNCFRFRLKKIGKFCFIDPRQGFLAKDLELGDFSFIGKNCTIYPKVKCGKFTLIAPDVSILGADHRFDLIGKPIIYSGREEIPETIIEDDVWIGKGSTILVGVKIGMGSIIATKSVVTKDIPEFSIVAGVPAIVLRQRFASAEDIEKHKQLLEEITQPGTIADSLQK